MQGFFTYFDQSSWLNIRVSAENQTLVPSISGQFLTFKGFNSFSTEAFKIQQKNHFKPYNFWLTPNSVIFQVYDLSLSLQSCNPLSTRQLIQSVALQIEYWWFHTRSASKFLFWPCYLKLFFKTHPNLYIYKSEALHLYILLRASYP